MIILSLFLVLSSSQAAHAETNPEALQRRARAWDARQTETEASRSLQKWESKFRSQGCRRALPAQEAAALQARGVDTTAAYWQHPRSKSGACITGRPGSLILNSDTFCNYSSKGESRVLVLNCRNSDGSPAFQVGYQYDNFGKQ
ncbi:MAG: hypothetical protein EOP06_29275 [Proteobacteria bacterium]|nr:MAG: hypothetical protein EOP06_29275 [Pseudomonadota bacterium]